MDTRLTAGYCKPINIGGYLIWQFLTSGHIDCYLNWLSLVMFSMNLIQAICIGGYLIWQFPGPSQIHQLKSPPNINRFTVHISLHYILFTTKFMIVFDQVISLLGQVIIHDWSIHDLDISLFAIDMRLIHFSVLL